MSSSPTLGAGARLSIDQRSVASVGNHTAAARTLLVTLTLDGALVTIDAIYAQAESALD